MRHLLFVALLALPLPALAASAFQTGLQAYRADDYGAAASAFSASAESGDPRAAQMLADMYASGRGVPADPGAAWQWRLRAAQLGDAGAQFVVGMRYLNGPGVVRDPNEAAFWLEQAARQNHPNAAFELGLLLLAGNGVTPDPERGLDWLRAAADLGLVDAQEALADIYGQGRAGVRKDAAASARWEAAARQNAQAGQQMNESIMQQQNAIAIARNTYYYRPAYAYPWGYPAWGVGWGRYGGWNYGVGVGGVWW